MIIFFGPNGSGKTTISRAFSGNERFSVTSKWRAGQELSVRVYNRDFVDHVLRDSHRLPGVFVLGEHSVQAEKRLETIHRPNGELEQAETRLENSEAKAQQTVDAKQEKYESLARNALDRLKTFMQDFPELKPAFTGKGGLSGDSKKLLEHMLELDISDDEAIPMLEELRHEASAVFDSSALALRELELLPAFGAENFEGYTLLQTKITGSANTTLSEVVDRLGNSDWVLAGREYLHQSEGICPFCQQPEPENLATELARLYDDQYSKLTSDVQTFYTAFKDWSRRFEVTIDSYNQNSLSLVEREEYLEVLDPLRLAIQANEHALEEKLRTPSATVDFTAIDKSIQDLNKLLDDVNIKIRTHNDFVQNRRSQRPQLVEKSRKYLARHVVYKDISEYMKEFPGLEKGIDALQQQVIRARHRVNELNDEVRDLQQSVHSTTPAIERINRMLTRAGFVSFQIVESQELENGYMLSRDGIQLEEQSLSEGERTFIAFLYYMQQLESREDADTTNRVLAIIDDPISSLDSDVLFIVGALIRDLIKRALERSDHIGQVILLTHNVYFHKEITHLNQGEKSDRRRYFVIRKQLDRDNTIEVHDKNPVSTEYERLWSEVRRASSGEEISVIGLENTIRRLLESYFKMVGRGIWIDEFADSFSREERPILDSLFSLMNQGSHGVFEDIYYSPTARSEQMYLEVLRKIFEETDQEGHYNMMIAERE